MTLCALEKKHGENMLTLRAATHTHYYVPVTPHTAEATALAYIKIIEKPITRI